MTSRYSVSRLEGLFRLVDIVSVTAGVVSNVRALTAKLDWAMISRRTHLRGQTASHNARPTVDEVTGVYMLRQETSKFRTVSRYKAPVVRGHCLAKLLL